MKRILIVDVPDDYTSLPAVIMVDQYMNRIEIDCTVFTPPDEDEIAAQMKITYENMNYEYAKTFENGIIEGFRASTNWMKGLLK